MAESATRTPLSVAAVAELVGGAVEGDGEVTVKGVAPVDEAGPDELGFLASRRYARHAATSRAGALLVAAELAERAPADRPRVVVEDAHRALQALLVALHPDERAPAGIHPTAVIAPGARLGDDVGIGPYAVVEADAQVGDGTRVGAHVVVGRGARVGRDCTLHPQVVLYPRTVVGDRVILHAGARLGVDGFGWAFVDGAPRKMPHVGRCVVGDDVEIGANSTVDRGSIGDTTVGPFAKLDNLVHLAHNVRLGAMSLLAALVGIAGSTRVGKGVLMGGQAGIINHLDIGDGVQVAAAAKVFRDVPAGEVISGHPARPNRRELRKQAHVERLPRLVERVKTLEAAVEEMRGSG